MKCLKPVRIFKNLDKVKFPMGLLVPCGQCMNCRIQKREEWTLRLMHELLYFDSCIFFTLTYSDEHLPPNDSLVKKDLQDFFKRLRKRLGKRKIKYFATGEYGEEFGRPHYHIIMYGMDYLNTDDRQMIKDSWNLADWNKLGRKPFGDVSIQSIRYVVSYIEKKILGKQEEFAYDGVEPAFHLVSKGIGKDFAMENHERLESTGSLQMFGFKRAIPRYYREVAEIPNDAARDFGRRKEIETVEQITGLKFSRDEAYLNAMPDEVVKIEDTIAASNRQHDLNLKARQKIKSRKKTF